YGDGVVAPLQDRHPPARPDVQADATEARQLPLQAALGGRQPQPPIRPHRRAGGQCLPRTRPTRTRRQAERCALRRPTRTAARATTTRARTRHAPTTPNQSTATADRPTRGTPPR